MKIKTLQRLSAVGLVAILLVGVVGCQSRQSEVAFGAYDPLGRELAYTTQFQRSVFRETPARQLECVAQARSAGRTEGVVTELLAIELQWKARPGVTYDDPSTTNAYIRYLVSNDDGAAFYEGAGFVFVPHALDRERDELAFEIDRAELVPRASLGEMVELSDRLVLTGKLYATRDTGATRKLERQLETQAAAIDVEVKAPE
jgi:hypothetical protein